MKVLVTGGAGFIGSHIVDTLIAKGHEVSILDDLSTGKLENKNPNAKFYQGSLLDDAFLASVFATTPYDAICHHAAQINVRLSVSDPAYDATVNIVGSLKLVEQAVKNNVKHFIFASTGGAIYGEPKTLPVSEESPTHPISPYGVAKLAFERYLYAYQVNYGLKSTVLRYGNVYGPRQDPLGEAGVIAIFMGKITKGETCIINGAGTQLRDYVYVEDVAAANLRALKTGASGTFNIGTGVGTSVNEIFSQLKAIYGKGIASHGPAKTGEIEAIYLNSAKAKNQLEWEPSTSLSSGLEKTIRWMAEK